MTGRSCSWSLGLFRISPWARAMCWRVARNFAALIAAGGFLVYWLVPSSPALATACVLWHPSSGLSSLSGVGELLGTCPSLPAWATWVAMVVWVVVPAASGGWRGESGGDHVRGHRNG